MTKVCENCGYEAEQAEQAEPTDPAEDCPKCGNILSLIDKAADLNEAGKDQLDEE